MVGRREQFFGNILLYNYLSRKRAPPFLERNLSQVFQVHEHLLKHGNTDDYLEPDSNFRSAWQPPSWDILDDMVEDENTTGSFNLEVHGIKRCQGASSDNNGSSVRKVRTLMRVECTIQISIHADGLDSINPPPQKAVLRGLERHNRKTSVEVDPITISLSDFHTDRLSIHKSYKMTLALSFASSNIVDELCRYMGLGIANVSKSMIAVHNDILSCQQDKVLLPLIADGRPLDLVIEASMYWKGAPGDSVLARWNQHLKTQTGSCPAPPPFQQNTPMAMQPEFRLTYVYADKQIELSDLSCLHCTKRKCRDVIDLQMHLNSWHDHFKYEAIGPNFDVGSHVQHWKFVSDLADHKATHRASDHADEPFDNLVIAPEQPFNREKALQGDITYHKTAKVQKLLGKSKPSLAGRPVAAKTRRKAPHEVQARPHKERKTYVVPKAPTGVTFFRACTRRPLQEGEEISESDDEPDEEWLHLQKYAELPKLSDGLSETAIRFLKMFDRFMHDEQVHSDIHLGDSMIRFAREQGAGIWQEATFEEFKKKLDELLEDDIISNKIHAGAVDIVESQKPSPIAQQSTDLSQRLAQLDVQQTSSEHISSRRSPRPRRRDKGKGKARVTETGHLTPITAADSDGDMEMREGPVSVTTTLQDTNEDPPFDQCYCGEDALATPSAKEVIACSSIDCIRRYFHTTCTQKQSKQPHTGIEQKPLDWTCDECKELSETPA